MSWKKSFCDILWTQAKTFCVPLEAISVCEVCIYVEQVRAPFYEAIDQKLVAETSEKVSTNKK